MYGDMTARPRMGAMEAFARGVPAELTTFVKKTYSMLAFSLVLGAAACFVMLRLMPTQEVLVRHGGEFAKVLVPAFPRWGLWLLWGGTFGFGILGSFAKGGARQGEASILGLVALVGLVVCSGAMLGPTIGTLVGLGMADVIGAAAITTAVTFTALTGVVLLTGKNFSFMGKFIFVAGIAFFVAWLVGIFFVHSAGFQWWLAAAGAVLFCAYILFDTSNVVHAYGPANMVVPAVIALYLDIFNLFVMLLYLFAGNRRNQ